MKIAELERRDDRGYTRLVSQVRDVSGDERFELRIAGPGKLVDEVLGDATIEVTVDSAQSTEDLKGRFDELRADHRKQLWSAAGLENIDDLFKPEPASPEPDTSVLMAIRPVSGEGTPFAITAAGFTVPRQSASSSSARGSSSPTALCCRPRATRTSTCVSSAPPGRWWRDRVQAGRRLDFVWLTLPSPFGPLPFLPVFEVLGFTTGVCATFSATGA